MSGYVDLEPSSGLAHWYIKSKHSTNISQISIANRLVTDIYTNFAATMELHLGILGINL